MMPGSTMEKTLRLQMAHVSKCLTSAESQPKTKHVRAIILGTFDLNGASPFFHLSNQMNLQAQPIVCYKFFFVLHKLLREGHANCIQDTIKNVDLIMKLGKLWGHLKDHYGVCIAYFAKLIIQKLKFHRKYPSVPGGLTLTGGDMVKMSGNNVDILFELSADIMDYLDEILRFQKAVYNSLDKSRSNSMTYAGQCRLAPIVQCIQDGAAIYDILVKLLFQLHDILPGAMLSGHRERFTAQFKLLHTFFEQSRQLQYFKNLIHIPALPENPPNFLIQSELATFKPPVVTTMTQAEEDDDDDTVSQVTVPESNLLDLSDTMDAISPSRSSSVDLFSSPFNFNGNSSSYDRNRDLQLENDALKEEIEKLKARHKEQIESLYMRIKSLENEVKALVQLKTRLEEEILQLRQLVQDSKREEPMLQEKFQKLRDAYTKLRNEHVEILRKNAVVVQELEVEKKRTEERDAELHYKSQALAQLEHTRMELSSLQKGAESSQSELSQARAELHNLHSSKQELENLLNSLKASKEAAEKNAGHSRHQVNELEDSKKALSSQLEELKARLQALSRYDSLRPEQLLQMQCRASSQYIRTMHTSTNDPQTLSTRCSAELLLQTIDQAMQNHVDVQRTLQDYQRDDLTIGEVLSSLLQFSGSVGDCLVCVKGTSNGAQSVDESDALLQWSNTLVDSICSWLANIHEGQQSQRVLETWSALKNFIEQSSLMSRIGNDPNAEEMGDILDQELKSTDDAIEAAERRFKELLDQSRSKHTGLQLEVNESILDSCTKLMNAIKVLVEKSKVLQREIVAEGRGTTSTHEFYKKHHRWTEGLISAAKAIGLNANMLVKEADKAVCGNEGVRSEQLEICSREISASTVQLVVTSRVKANPGSVNLRNVMEASSDVTKATGRLVASAKSAAEILEKEEVLDFSKLSLTQSKMAEMESQVRLLQLESQVTQERRKLAELRKQHYKLAGEVEELK